VSARLAPSAVVDDLPQHLVRKAADRPRPVLLQRHLQLAMRDRVLPDLGGGRLSEIRRVDLQDFADRLRGPREC
jgi:hypothetical protein